MGFWKITIVDINTETNEEIGATEDEYDFFVEALIVANSVSAGFFIDENRVALAKGETCRYDMLNGRARDIQIVENR